MMNARQLLVARLLLILSPLLLPFGGCASPKYAPQRYTAAQDRFGAITLSTTKKVYVCPTIDSLPSECRKCLDPKFTPWEHATDALEQELQASGLTPVRPDFAFGPSFEDLKEVVAEKARRSENAVYVGTELLWLSPERWTVDARLLSPAGDTLFEKRGTCVILGSGTLDAQEITHMALRQILADPNFNGALQ
jgi:hypothetical protein